LTWEATFAVLDKAAAFDPPRLFGEAALAALAEVAAFDPLLLLVLA
jgi:hypothetical protein